MKIVAEVNDNFQPGIPAIDRELDKADGILTSSEDDLSLSLRDEFSSRSKRVAGKSPNYG